MSKIKIFFILFLGIFGFFYFIHSKKSDWFSPEFITYDKTYWPITSKSSVKIEDLECILNQPFSFLGSGNQTFAFESQDGEHVLKFFKFQHLKKKGLLPFLDKSKESKAKRIYQVFLGHSLAFSHNAHNSGLLYVHLDPSLAIPFKATVYDKKKSKHIIPLQDVVFVIQKKGKSMNRVLSELLKEGNVEGAKEHIRKLFAMYLDEYSKGLYDRDHNVMHNAGFSQGEPIHIDIGKLRSDEKMKEYPIYIEDLKKIAWERVDKWIYRYYPQYREEISHDMNNFFKELELLQN